MVIYLQMNIEKHVSTMLGWKRNNTMTMQMTSFTLKASFTLKQKYLTDQKRREPKNSTKGIDSSKEWCRETNRGPYMIIDPF